MDIVISVLILLVILFFFIDGIRRGFFRAVFEIAGIVAAFISAYYFGHQIAAALAGSLRVSQPALLYFFSFVLFVAVIVIFHLIGLLIQKIVSATVLGPVDRIGGAVFGAFKGVLVVSLLLVVLAWLPLPEAFKEDVRGNALAARIHPVLPETYRLIMRSAPATPAGTIDRMDERPEESRETVQRRTA
jgi:membrane protein required for colicin V production